MIMSYIAWLIMFTSWCVAYRTINSLKKELNRFKYNESHYKAVLKKLESELEILIRQYNELEKLVHSTSDPQYVDEWFRFKKMF